MSSLTVFGCVGVGVGAGIGVNSQVPALLLYPLAQAIQLEAKVPVHPLQAILHTWQIAPDK